MSDLSVPLSVVFTKVSVPVSVASELDTEPKVLLSDSIMKVIDGQIEVRNFNDLVRLMMVEEGKRQHDLQYEKDTGISNKSVENAYRQLGFIMVALKEKIAPDQLYEVVKRAWSLGLDKEVSSFADVPMYQIEKVPEPDMTVATEDLKRGIKRSSEEKRAIALGELPNPYANEDIDDIDIPPTDD